LNSFFRRDFRRVAKILRVDWRVGRFVAGAFVGLRDGRRSFLNRLHKPKPATAPVGTKFYWSWIRNHDRELRRANQVQSPHSFLVFIEADKNKKFALKRTVKSIRRAGGKNKVNIAVIPSGRLLTKKDFSGPFDLVLFLIAGCAVNPIIFRKIDAAFHRDPSTQVLTFDSDVKRVWGRGKPLFRPILSPEMLLSSNYIGRSFAVRTDVARRCVSMPLDDEGVWKLLLNHALVSDAFGQEASVLLTDYRKPRRSATISDAQMVQKSLNDAGQPAKVSVDSGIIRVIFEPEHVPTVSIVIPSRHSRENLSRVLLSLQLTDYEKFDVCVIDNGEPSPDNKAWYESMKVLGFTLDVIWHRKDPFNYSAVNNLAASKTRGDVIVFLNDDTEIVDKDWLRELVGLVSRPGIGSAGFRHLNSDRLIQHGGVMIGPGGFADNLFAGMRPDTDTLIGSTTWYRNTVAVTGACVAVKRSLFEAIGGLDESFILCGSDVVMGLDIMTRGLRNVVSPTDAVRHLESVTRGTDVPNGDFFASYWRYRPWLENGDPYVSPNVSQLSTTPKLSSPRDLSPVARSLQVLKRVHSEVRQSADISREALGLIDSATASKADIENIRRQHEKNSAPANIRTVNWFLPDMDTPFFGGFNTIFRIASKLATDHGVKNRFFILSAPNDSFFRSAISAAFPNLSDSEILFYDGAPDSIAKLPKGDASIATLWLTAFHMAQSRSAPRYFYLIQDFEPGFYPASSMFALAEETYRLGLYGICNTPTLARMYRDDYDGTALEFSPAVDRLLYSPDQLGKRQDSPVTIFVYARDHFRNCQELALGALLRVKEKYGDRVRIIVAGARYLDDAVGFIDLGLVDIRQAAAIYRTVDIGLTLQISRHPSYLPLELMASGVPMIAPDRKDFHWLLRSGENSRLTEMTIDGVFDALCELVDDPSLRRRLAAAATKTIDEYHSDWDSSLAGVYDYLCDPESHSDPNASPQF